MLWRKKTQTSCLLGNTGENRPLLSPAYVCCFRAFLLCGDTPPGPSYDVQRHVLPERRNLSGDVNENAHSGSGGGSAGGQNRSHPRPFVQSHDRRGMRYAREATGKDSQRYGMGQTSAVKVSMIRLLWLRLS